MEVENKLINNSYYLNQISKKYFLKKFFESECLSDYFFVRSDKERKITKFMITILIKQLNINQRHHDGAKRQQKGTFTAALPADLTYVPLKLDGFEDTYEEINDLVKIKENVETPRNRLEVCRETGVNLDNMMVNLAQYI